MSKMYWQLYYHIVWSTKGRQPLISEDVQDVIIRYIQAKCDEMGCVLRAIGTAADHVHILVSIPPDVRISDFIRDIKGGSSHLVNHEMGLDAPFYWQRGAGVISISSHDKVRVIEYVRRQREKHASGDLLPSLERTGEDTDSSDPA